MEIVVDRLWVPRAAKVLNINVKCSTSVEKSYIMMTVILYDGTLAPKTDRFRGEGSNPLVKLIQVRIGRIGSASGFDPPDRYRPGSDFL